MNIFYSKSAVKAIRSLDKSTKQNLKTRIDGLTKEPPDGDIKRMKGFQDNKLRLRVGKYRVIFKFEIEENNKTLYIIDIGSRGDIYK